MPWISQRSLDRLERDLLSTLQRAERAEQALAAERQRADDIVAGERQSKDYLILQLASRVVQKHGGYALEAEPKPTEPPPPHPKGFIREPNEHDNARLDWYKKCYLEAGKSEEEAQAVWEAEMRGEVVKYEYEQEQ